MPLVLLRNALYPHEALLESKLLLILIPPAGSLLTFTISDFWSVVPIKLVLLVPLFPAVSQLPAPAVRFCQALPVLYQNDRVTVSYTNRPGVLGMASRLAVPMRGIRIPLLADLISSMALESGNDPSMLIA